jgi:hypothetical protein
MLIGGAILAVCAWFFPVAALLAATVLTLAIPEPHAPRGSRAAGPAALGA